jgi:predicted ribosomally synthesized peptide with SipW-like signal peptide
VAESELVKTRHRNYFVINVKFLNSSIMKKIITSVGMIVFVAAIVAGGTGAFFSDTETSTGNTFTAGAIDLKVDSVAHINGLVCFDGAWHPEGVVVWDSVDEVLELAPGVDEDDVADAVEAYNEDFPSNVPQAGDACKGTWALTDLEGEVAYQFFNYGDLKPGDNGENTISLHVENNDAYMCATVDVTEDKDNTQTEPEADVPDVDGLVAGELDNELELIVWEDDGDNVLETPELENILVETESANGIEGTYDLYTSLTGAIPASTTAYMGVYWCYGDLTRSGTTLTCDGGPVTNVSQTDSLKADIKFYVEQARHNEEFTCEERDPEPLPDPILTLEKVVNQDGVNSVSDSNWTLTATGVTTTVTGTDNDPAPSPLITNISVPAGVYTLTEAGNVAGFTFQGIQCTDGVLVGNVLTLAPGDNAVCTFTNIETNQQ